MREDFSTASQVKGGKDKSKQIKVIKMVSIVIHFLCLNNNISDNMIILQTLSRLKKLCNVLCKGRLSHRRLVRTSEILLFWIIFMTLFF